MLVLPVLFPCSPSPHVSPGIFHYVNLTVAPFSQIGIHTSKSFSVASHSFKIKPTTRKLPGAVGIYLLLLPFLLGDLRRVNDLFLGNFPYTILFLSWTIAEEKIEIMFFGKDFVSFFSILTIENGLLNFENREMW